MREHIYFSVDVETSGTRPGENVVLSIGAVPVVKRQSWEVADDKFYVEISPHPDAVIDPSAMAVNRLNLDELRKNGKPNYAGWCDFLDWVLGRSFGKIAIFAGWHVSFDWGFLVHEARQELRLGQDELPFFRSPFDIRSMAYQITPDVDWSNGREIRRLCKQRLGIDFPSGLRAHHALDDALEQATILAALLNLNRPWTAL